MFFLIGTACVLMILFLVGGKYDWVSEVQPGISSELIEDHADNRQLTKLFLLFILMTAQIPCLLSKNVKMMFLSFALISLGLILSCI